MRDFLATAWARLKSESPRFFVRVRNVCGGVATAATALKAALVTLSAPEWGVWIQIADFLIGAGAAGVFVASLTTIDTELQKQ